MLASNVTQPWAHKGGAGLLVWIVGYVGVALLWVQLALSGVSFNLRMWLSPLTPGKGLVTTRKDLLTAEKVLLTSGKTEPWIL